MASTTALILSCVVTLLVVGVAEADEHNIVHGSRMPNDKLLFHKTASVGGFFFWVKDDSFCFPSDFPSKPLYEITAYNVTDLMPEGEGGYPSVSSGGIGQTQVCFNVQSQRGSGFNFVFHIWGYETYEDDM